MADTLLGLRREYRNIIRFSKYVSSIDVTCYFYNTGEFYTKNGNEYESWEFWKKKQPLEGNKITTSNVPNKENYSFSTYTDDYYYKIIEKAKYIIINKKNLAETINSKIGELVGTSGNVDLGLTQQLATEIPNSLQVDELLDLLGKYKSKVENIDVSKDVKKLCDLTTETKLEVNRWGIGDKFMSFTKPFFGSEEVRQDEYWKYYTRTEPDTRFHFPNKKTFLNYLLETNYGNLSNIYDGDDTDRDGQVILVDCVVLNDKVLVSKSLGEILDGTFNKRLKKVRDQVVDAIIEVEKLIKEIKTQYDIVQEKQKAEYDNSLNIYENGYVINANDAYVDKLLAKGKKYNKKEMAKLYRKLKKKKSKEDAADIIAKLIRKTGASFYLSDVKSVILKKKKKKNKKDKANTGATVVDTGNNNNNNNSNNNGKNKDDDKKKDKNKNKKKKPLANAAAAAAAKKEKREKAKVINNIKTGTNNKIEQAKLNLNKKISQIDNDRDAKIANIESKRDNDIANLYDDASNKINNIDATDTDAQQQINAIKENLENEVNSVNNNANVEIEKVKASAEQQKSQANQNTQNTIEKIQNKSTEEIKNIKENGVSKKTKATKNFESAAKETPTAENVDTSSLEEANSNKAESAVSLENSKTEYNNSIAEKEQEIVNQTNSVENSNDITESTDVNDLNESTDSIDSNNSTETVATEVENVSNSEQTPVNNQSYNTSDSGERNYSTNSYNSSNSATTSSMNSTNEASNASSNSIASDVESEVIETPAVPDDSNEVPLIPDNPNNEEIQEIDNSSTSSEILDTPKSESKSSNIAIPIGLGVAATGAAAVAGVRFVKNRKQNEDIDETYDDENNDIDSYESGSDNSAYMKDDYLGPIGSMYTDTDYPEDNELSEIPDDTKYTDAGQLEDEDFSVDEVLNGLG